MTKIIAVDDGSTTIKVATINKETDEISAAILTHSFDAGHVTGEFSRSNVYNFTVNGGDYHFTKHASSAAETTTTSFQYSVQCAMAVHLALLTAAPISKPEDVVLYVTLPIDEYYINGSTKNTNNIKRKIETIKQKVEIRDGIGENGGSLIPVYNIVRVEVVPEGICAVMLKIKEEEISSFDTTMVADLGGSTLDVCNIHGDFESVEHKGFPVGVRPVIEGIISASKDGKRINQFIANHIIQNYNDQKEFERVIKSPSLRSAISESYTKSVSQLSADVTDKCTAFSKSPDYVVLVGGGIPLVEKEIRAAYPESKFFEVDNAQTEQSIAILEYALYTEDERNTQLETEQA